MPVRIPFLANFLVHGSTHGRSPAARARWEPALFAPLGVVTAGTHLRREPFRSPEPRFIVLPARNVKDGPRRRRRNRGARAFRDAPCPGAWLLRVREGATARGPAPHTRPRAGTPGPSWRTGARGRSGGGRAGVSPRGPTGATVSLDAPRICVAGRSLSPPRGPCARLRRPRSRPGCGASARSRGAATESRRKAPPTPRRRAPRVPFG